MILLENITKIYPSKNGEVRAVDNVTLQVKKGEIHGVIGYSGAGKSTLIRCVNLLEEPTSGKVVINDSEITNLSNDQLRKVRQNIGMIFQGFNLLKTATVYDNIAIPLKLRGLSSKEVASRVHKYLDIVDLSDKKKSYPSQLSGGQKQRVAVARALAQEPEVLLSDEATSALDPESTDALLDLLLKINEELGITILLITHEMNVIQKICDQVTVMENGKAVEQGAAMDLFATPKHPTTQKFLNTISQRRLSPSVVSQLNLEGRVVRLTFIGENTGQPILSKLSRDFQVDPNILTANIMDMKNGIIGNLVIHLSGEKEQIDDALLFLENEQVKVERLEGN